MEYLIQLHEQLYPNYDKERLRNDKISEFNIKYELNELNKIIDSNIDDNEKIKAIIHMSAVILLYQPFYDGNSHVSRLFLSKTLDKIGYSLDYNKIKNMIIIPQIYSYEDTISDKQFEQIYNLIENKNILK